MSGLLLSINSSAGRALAAELNTLWLALAVVFLVWLVLKFLPRINAATRHAIWWGVLGVVLILPLSPQLARWWQSPEPGQSVPLPQHAAQRPEPPPLAAEPAFITVAPERVGTWPLWAFAVWAAVLVFRLGQIGHSWIFLRNVKRHAKFCSHSMPVCGVRRPVLLLLSREVESPMAVGFLKPAVILPESLTEELSGPELDHVLLHEMAHIARGDDWTNLAARLAGAALALHPVALWILRQIERQREMACDDFVVARTGDARPYARSLAKLFEMRFFRIRWPRRADLLGAGILGRGRGSRLGDRIEALLRRGRHFPPRASLARVAASVVLLLGFMGAGSLAPRWIVLAQQPTRLAFEVASVKPAKPDDSRRMGIQVLPGGRFSATNVPVCLLVRSAYDIPFQSPRLSGCSHTGSETYDIEAAAEQSALTPGESARARSLKMRSMLQTLLAERFKLVVRRETGEVPVYAVVVAKNGPKLQRAKISEKDCPEPPAPFDASCHVINGGMGRGLHAPAIDMSDLASVLENWLDRPVVDQTGIKGLFNVQTEGWAPLAPRQGQQESDEAKALADPSRPTLFSIFEELGLRLVSKKAPIEMIVVEHVEKPSEN